MTPASHQLFGRRKLPHTIIIARGEAVRQFVVGPWLARALTLLSAGAAVAVVGSVAFLASERDWTGLFADEPDLAASYELRIASLRSEVDRLTIRSFVDRDKVSSKVDALLERQAELTDRYAKLQPLIDRARVAGLIETPVPVPAPKPVAAPQPLAYQDAADHPALRRFDLVDRTGATSAPAEAATADLIRRIARSNDDAEAGQIEGLDRLAARAKAKTDAIGEALRTEGIGRLTLPENATSGGEGGPFVAVPPERRFEASLVELGSALDTLEAVREASAALPLKAPVASTAVSSPFGVRADPFLGKAAMHTGIDFVETEGAAVKSTAPGKVAFAGEKSGYGQMVEVDHGNGLSTRYAHLSGIDVRVGQPLAAGAVLGRVGSTGRSTGPHLHYEVRQAGDAVDPARFLKAGRRIDALG